jgi:hypothetical protein
MAGGYGAGKTMTLTGKMLKLSAINNPIPIVWTVPQWAHVERTILPTIGEVDTTGRSWFLEPNQFHYHPQRHMMTWDGGGQIQFASAEHEDSIKGPNVAAAGVDEPGIVSQRAWRNTMARVRHPAAPLRQRVAAGTPEGLNWLMDYFGSAADRPDHVRVYTMSTEENTELPAEYLAQLKANATAAELQAYVSGKFVNLTGALAYQAFDPEVHWTERVALDPDLPLRVTFDFNVDPMACVIGQQAPGPHGDEARVVDAVVLPSSVVMDVCDEIQRRYPKWGPGIVVYGDATGKARSTVNRRSNYDIIRDMLAPIGRVTVKVPASNPPVTQRLNSVNRLLADGHGRVRLYLRKTLPVQECSVRPLVRSLQQSVKKPGTDQLWKKSGETVTHAADALGYWVDQEWPAVAPRHIITAIKANQSQGVVSSAVLAARARRRANMAAALGVET